MDTQQNFKVPQSLIKIPDKKLFFTIEKIKQKCSKCSKFQLCDSCSVFANALQRYWGANIPVDYWLTDMDINFQGNPKVKKIYEQVVNDLDKAYSEGIRICLAGPHGVGKTMSCCCMLKRALENGFSALFLNLGEIVDCLASGYSEEKKETKEALTKVDFLFIDEFDPRYVGSESAADLYGRMLEPTLRHRIQNKLPIFLCTNSPNVLNTFSGSIKTSLSSLMNLVKVIPVAGEDFRKNIQEGL